MNHEEALLSAGIKLHAWSHVKRFGDEDARGFAEMGIRAYLEARADAPMPGWIESEKAARTLLADFG